MWKGHKIVKTISHIFWRLLSNVKTSGRFFFEFLWSFQKTWTLMLCSVYFNDSLLLFVWQWDREAWVDFERADRSRKKISDINTYLFWQKCSNSYWNNFSSKAKHIFQNTKLLLSIWLLIYLISIRSFNFLDRYVDQ